MKEPYSLKIENNNIMNIQKSDKCIELGLLYKERYFNFK